MSSEKPSSKILSPPPIIKETDWEEVELPFNIGSGRTLFSGLENEGRLRLRVFRRESDGRLVGRVWFGPGADGPPGHAHGGAIAYVLDEAMGSAAWMNHYPVVAAKLEFQYERMTPLNTDLGIEAWIEKESGRRLVTVARLTLPSGEPCVVGRGEFAILSKSKIVALSSSIVDSNNVLKNPQLKWAPEGTTDDTVKDNED